MERPLIKKTIRPHEAAEVYGISAGTLANLRSRKEGPQYFKRGRAVFYFVRDFEAWLTRNPVLTRESVGS